MDKPYTVSEADANSDRVDTLPKATETSTPMLWILSAVILLSSCVYLVMCILQSMCLLLGMPNHLDIAKDLVMFNIALLGSAISIKLLGLRIRWSERFPGLVLPDLYYAVVVLGLMVVGNVLHINKLVSSKIVTFAAKGTGVLTPLTILSWRYNARFVPESNIYRLKLNEGKHRLVYSTDSRHDDITPLRLHSSCDLALILLANKEIHRLFLAMLKGQDFTYGYTSNAAIKDIIRTIQAFGHNLAGEVEDQVLLGTATIMKTRQGSYEIAVAMAEAAGRLLRKLSTQQPADGLDHWEHEGYSHIKHYMEYPVKESVRLPAPKHNQNEIVNDSNVGNESHITATQEITSLLNSDACLRFEADLLQLAHEVYEARLIALLGDVPLVETSGDRLTGVTRLHMIREISWVPTYLFTTGRNRPILVNLVEFVMGEAWDRWAPRSFARSLRSDYTRLHWTSPYGIVRQLDIPSNVCWELRSAMKGAPTFINIERPSNPSSYLLYGPSNTVIHGGHTAASPSTNALSVVASTHPSQGQSRHGQQHSAPSPVAYPIFYSTTQHSPASPSNQYLLLCVTGSSRRFLCLECDKIQTDAQLFETIKQEYNNARGWMRLHFSLWQYDHCEFYQFKKYSHMGGGARLRIAFPDPSNNDYDFKPRIPEPEPPFGPISSDEFRDHYYRNDCPSFFNWRRFQLQARGHYKMITRECIEAVPKRKARIDMHDGTTLIFYGLCARERQSLSRIILYICLCNLPAVIFAFLWLFQWGYGSDLQNAYVPLGLTLMLTTGFATLVYSADADKKKTE